MIYLMYAILDKKAGEFTMPIAQHNDDTAKRYFRYIIQNNKSIPASDCELFCIGTYDSERGVFTPISPIVFIEKGVDKEE